MLLEILSCQHILVVCPLIKYLIKASENVEGWPLSPNLYNFAKYAVRT